MEVDRGPVMVPVSVATSHEFDHLDLAVDPFGGGICDPVLEVGQDVGQVPLERFGRFDHRRDTRVRRPEVPGREVLLRALLVSVPPDLTQRFLDRPRTARLELRVLDRRELLAAPVGMFS